ncbi:MAG: prepilin peptidase [Bacteroidota bacterium]
MDWLAIGIATLSCLSIAWQDFRSRRIHMLAFLLLAGSVFLNHISWENVALNWLMIAMVISIVWLFFRIKTQGPVMDKSLGWGDVVMLLCLGLWLEPVWFLGLYTVSTTLLAIIYLILQKTGRPTSDHNIPLAGYLAIAALFILPLQHLFA